LFNLDADQTQAALASHWRTLLTGALALALGLALVYAKAMRAESARLALKVSRSEATINFQKTGRYWSNHFSTIGVIGANEACLNFLGEDISTDRGREFSLKILTHIRERLVDWQEKTGVLFNLEATPAEGTSYRLAKIDSEIARTNFIAEIPEGEELFYANSTHFPVNKTEDIFSALEHQDELQCLYTGGTVLHGFIGEKIDDLEVVKALVKKVVTNYKLPYFTLTPRFSVCPDHGYLTGERPECPDCGQATEVYSRVVGYYRPVSRWNDGKQSEFKLRKTYENAALGFGHLGTSESPPQITKSVI
jgi:ribonucleoside-triphosphate reductase